MEERVNPAENSTNLGDRIALRISRAITRRTLFRRGAQMAAATGAATGLRLYAADSASATLCSAAVSTWGCYCSGTTSCGSSRCCDSGDGVYDACCGGATRRGNYWGSYPHCWCSLTCCLGGEYGYYSCCDCWQYGVSGQNPCSCKGYHFHHTC
jgi:hypothetical protein